MQAIYRPLFPYAPSHNIRIIAVNGREYPGSSRVTDEQLAILQSDNKDEQEAAFIAWAQDVARFVSYIITHEGVSVPRTTGQKKTGGVCMLGWAAGNRAILGVAAHLRSFEEPLQKILEQYVTSVIAFGKRSSPSDLAC